MRFWKRLPMASLVLGASLALPIVAVAQTPVVRDCEASGGDNCSADIDKNGATLSSDFVISEVACPTIFGMKVQVQVEHSWVGDLVVTLSNGVETVKLLERPGQDSIAYGCSSDNIDALFTDKAKLPGQEQCSFLYPAIGGEVKPKQPLGVFEQSSAGGTWTLSITDIGEQISGGFFNSNAGDDDFGRLLGWGLILQCSESIPAQGRGATVLVVAVLLALGPALLLLRRRNSRA
jgi:hypothetical protein